MPHKEDDTRKRKNEDEEVGVSEDSLDGILDEKEDDEDEDAEETTGIIQDDKWE